MTARRTPQRLTTDAATARQRTESEGRADRREGRYSQPGKPEHVWREPPVNGRPVRWYVYRGHGPFADEEW